MAVIKLTSSKKAVLFIDDEGNTFITSVNFLVGLLNGKSPYGFVSLARLPGKVADGRFKKSKLYDPSGVYENVDSKTLSTNTDVLSQKVLKEGKEKKGFVDKKVW